MPAPVGSGIGLRRGLQAWHDCPADTAGRSRTAVLHVHCDAATRADAAMPAPPTRHEIPARRLLALLGSGQARSGSALASELGVSRAAVWKQIEQLRAAGLAIEAQAGHGYRLAEPVELLELASIHAALPAAIRRRLGGIELHWQLDSSNDELLRRVGRGLRDHSLCLAEQQSAGRGRRGRSWHTPLGGALALSLYRRCDGAMARLAGLSLVAGLAAIHALAQCGIAGVDLKWPNDLVFDQAKLGGILIDVGGEALGPCHAVIGIGINLRLGPAAARIGQAATDLAALGPLPSRNLLAARLITALEDTVDRFLEEGLGAFAARYREHDSLRGREVDVLRGGARLHGTALGVDARGALRVRLANGEQVIDSGEVSVRARR